MWWRFDRPIDMGGLLGEWGHDPWRHEGGGRGLCKTLQESLRRPGVRKKRHENGDVVRCWRIVSQEGWSGDWVDCLGNAGGVIGGKCQCGAAVCQAESMEVKLKVATIPI